MAGVVHCPYCHGRDVDDEPIGVPAVDPASVHHAWLFRQLTEDVVCLTRGTELDHDTRARFPARDIRDVDTPVAAVESTGDDITASDSSPAGSCPRRVLALAATMLARTHSALCLGTDEPSPGRARHDQQPLNAAREQLIVTHSRLGTPAGRPCGRRRPRVAAAKAIAEVTEEA